MVPFPKSIKSNKTLLKKNQAAAIISDCSCLFLYGMKGINENNDRCRSHDFRKYDHRRDDCNDTLPGPEEFH